MCRHPFLEDYFCQGGVPEALLLEVRNNEPSTHPTETHVYTSEGIRATCLIQTDEVLRIGVS
jgi:hypothetical protein